MHLNRKWFGRHQQWWCYLIIQEALSMKTNEHAELMKEVASLREALEQKAVSNENS